MPLHLGPGFRAAARGRNRPGTRRIVKSVCALPASGGAAKLGRHRRRVRAVEPDAADIA
jgi:hypothetical protein